MTSNQYLVEDTVVSANDMVASFSQQSAQSTNLPALIADEVNKAVGELKQLKEAQKAAGNKDMVALINQAGRRILDIANKSTQQAIALENANEVIQFINEERLTVIKKLDELETALDEGDMSHPAVENFAYYLREEAFSDAYEAALSEAESSVFDDIMERIQKLTGCNTFQSYCVTRLLNSNREATPDQVHLLQQLVDTFERQS